MAARLYLLHDKSNQGGLRPRGWGAAEITPSTLLCSLRLLSVPCLFCTSVNLARLLQPPKLWVTIQGVESWNNNLFPLFILTDFILQKDWASVICSAEAPLIPAIVPRSQLESDWWLVARFGETMAAFFYSKSRAHGGRFRLTSHHPEWEQESTRVDKTLKSLMCSIQRAKRETMVEIYSSWSR